MSAGLLESSRTLVARLIALGSTRFELFSTELREEFARLATTLLGGLVVIALAALSLGFAGFAIVLVVGEPHRVLAVCIIAAVFLLAAVALAWGLLRVVRAKPRAFDATLTELERDYQTIKPS